MKLYIVIENWCYNFDEEYYDAWRFIRGAFKDEAKAVDYCLHGVKTMHGAQGYDDDSLVPAEITDTNQDSIESFRVELQPIGCDDRWAEPHPESVLRIEVHELTE